MVSIAIFSFSDPEVQDITFDVEDRLSNGYFIVGSAQFYANVEVAFSFFQFICLGFAVEVGEGWQKGSTNSKNYLLSHLL